MSMLPLELEPTDHLEPPKLCIRCQKEPAENNRHFCDKCIQEAMKKFYAKD